MIKFGNSSFWIEVSDRCLDEVLVPIRLGLNHYSLGNLNQLTNLPSFLAALQALVEKDELDIGYCRDKLMLAASPAADNLI